MTNRITITTGDYIPLSDIPNEQVFDLVKECFVNAGFNSISRWGHKHSWDVFHAYGEKYSCFANLAHEYNKRQLSLSDVLNSTNGGFNWGYYTTPIRKFTLNDIKFIYAVCGAEMVVLDKLVDCKETPDTHKITKAFDLNNLQHMDIDSILGRATGKSTAHHLELISRAMKSPEQWVKVYSDHTNLHTHHRWAFEEVKDLCYKLGLDWMEFGVSLNSLRYMPYQTVKMATKWEVVE